MPEELADAAVPAAVLDAELEVLLAVLMVAGPDEELELKLSWLVTSAVRPVTFVQLELTVVLIPVTKLTGAH